MDRSDLITLIAQTYTKDEIGQEVATEAGHVVYCDRVSIDRDEFYASGQAGIEAVFKVRVFAFDYHGETLAEYHGKRYKIYRTYYGRNDTLELYFKSEAGLNG